MAVETKKSIDIIKNALANLEGEDSFAYSVEHFPLKTADGLEAVYKDWFKFSKNGAQFVDLAWGPAPADITAQTSRDVNTVFGLEGQMHLTVSQQSPEAVSAALKLAKDLGVRNIFALRGNPPKEPVESNLKNAVVSSLMLTQVVFIDAFLQSYFIAHPLFIYFFITSPLPHSVSLPLPPPPPKVSRRFTKTGPSSPRTVLRLWIFPGAPHP